MAPVTRSARGGAAAPAARALAVSRALPNVVSIRRLSTEVGVSLNINIGVRISEETGNATTNNTENENIPEAAEQLNDSVQFVDVLNNTTGIAEVVDLTTDTETEEDSVASRARENVNVALNPVMVDLSGNDSSINVPNVSSEIVDLTDSPTPSPAPAPPSVESGLGCPICLESVAGVKRTGASMVSTVCGHIFCSACLPNSIKVSGSCPTCRRPLSIKLGWHKIFI